MSSPYSSSKATVDITFFWRVSCFFMPIPADINSYFFLLFLKNALCRTVTVFYFAPSLKDTLGPFSISYIQLFIHLDTSSYYAPTICQVLLYMLGIQIQIMDKIDKHFCPIAFNLGGGYIKQTINITSKLYIVLEYN